MKKTKKENTECFDAELGIADKISRMASSGISLEELFDYLFDQLHGQLKYNRMDIGFTEDQNQRILLTHVKSDYSPLHLSKNYAVDLYGSQFQLVFDTGKPHIIQDLEKYRGERRSEPIALMLKEGINSMIICPIFADETIIGIFSISSKKKNSYSARDSEFVQTIIERISLIIEKTYRLEQIEKTTATYMEMLSVVSHEMKSPLSSIITLGKTLINGYFGKVEEKQRNIVERMIKKAEYLHTLSSEYLSLSRFESGEFQLNPQLIDFLHEIIEPSIDIIQPQIDEKKIEFIQDYTERVYPINCDPDLIRIVAINLLSNAVKYGNTEGKIRLSIEHSYKRIKFSVWNEGPGFSELEKKMLFRKFSRLQSEELAKRKGTGVGLYVSWKIIQLHGGTIKADSEKGKWAEFYFELPQYMDMCIIN